MFRQILPAAIAYLLTGCAPSEPEPPIPVIACIGTEGRWLRGEITMPAFSGQFSARTNDGATCTASWRTPLNTGTHGTGTLSCSDGLTAEIDYLTLSLRRGIAIGSGQTNTRETISIWTGVSVPDRVAQLDNGALTLRCDALSLHRPTDTGNQFSTIRDD